MCFLGNVFCGIVKGFYISYIGKEVRFEVSKKICVLVVFFVLWDGFMERFSCFIIYMIDIVGKIYLGLEGFFVYVLRRFRGSFYV